MILDGCPKCGSEYVESETPTISVDLVKGIDLECISCGEVFLCRFVLVSEEQTEVTVNEKRVD